MSSNAAGRPNEVTRVLAEISDGVPGADVRLLQVVYGELKRIAAAKMSAQDPGHTLQPTALVHEAYLRLLGGTARAPDFRDSAHFFTAAAAAMRSILVDHARKKGAAKRGGDRVRVALHEGLAHGGDPLDRVLQVNEVLDQLAVDHPRAAKVVELLFFAGLSVKEAAGVIGVADRTVKRDWRFGRAWLLRRMDDS